MAALVMVGGVLVAGPAVGTSSAETPSAPGGTFVPAAATAFGGSLGPGETRSVTVPGIPAGATASLTVAVTSPAAAGSVVVWTPGTAVPTVATVVFAPGQSAVNAAAVPVSPAGTVSVRNTAARSVHVRIDATGSYAPGAATSAGGAGWTAPATVANQVTIAGGASIKVRAAGVNGVPADAAVVVANLVAAAPSAAATLTAFPTGASVPATASLVLTPGRPQASLGLIRVSSGGEFTVLNRSTARVTLSIGVNGYFLSGTPTIAGAFQKVAPASLLRTTLAGNTTVERKVIGVATVPSAGVTAVAVQLGADNPGADGALVAYPTGSARPAFASVVLAHGRPAANLVIVPVDAAGTITILNRSSRSVAINAEIVGYYLGASRLTWSAPTVLNTTGPAAAQAVSCASRTFCLVAEADGFFDRWDGNSWTRLSDYSLFDPDDDRTSVRDLSCPSATFCVAVFSWTTPLSGVFGFTMVWNGQSWRQDQVGLDVGLGTESVECVSTTFCLATLESSGYATWNGSQWTTSADDRYFENLVCGSAAFCLATADQQAVRFDGSSWTPTSPAPVAGPPSCPTATFCLVVGTDDAGRPMWSRYNGTTWSPAAAAPAAGPVSCASPTFCLATGSGSFVFNGSAWSAAPGAPGGGSAIDCGAASSCAAISGTQASVYSSGGWSSPFELADHPQGLSHVSCVDPSFCVATDRWDAIRFSTSGLTGIDPNVAIHHFTINDELRDVSCVTSTFCVTSGGAIFPRIRQWDGTGWGYGYDQRYDGLSCASTSFCLAVGAGAALGYDGTAWAEIGGPVGLSRVSCPTTTFCLATGGTSTGTSVIYDGSTWSSPISMTNAGGGAPHSLSCRSTTFCVAADQAGRVSIFNGSTWSAPAAINGSSKVVAVACPTAGACFAATDDRLVAQYKGNRWAAPTRLAGRGKVTDITCPTSGFCAVVDDTGNVVYGRA